MHLRRSEQPHGKCAAPHAVADEQSACTARAYGVLTGVVPVIERTGRDENRLSPGKHDLTAVRMSAEREVEYAVADLTQCFWRVHEHDPPARRAVHRCVGARVAMPRVIEAADGQIVERRG